MKRHVLPKQPTDFTPVTKEALLAQGWKETTDKEYLMCKLLFEGPNLVDKHGEFLTTTEDIDLVMRMVSNVPVLSLYIGRGIFIDLRIPSMESLKAFEDALSNLST